MIENLRFIQARNYTKANRTKIDLIVIHTMEAPEKGTTAENIASWFAGESAPKASAHFCVDSDSAVYCVRVEDVAWHAPGANHNGVGIEHAGFAKQTREEWQDDYSQAMLHLSALVAAELCERFDIPVEHLSVDDLKAGKRGFCGHIDITNAFNDRKGHWDPGEGFPWDQYLAMIAHVLAPTEPTTEPNQVPLTEHIDGIADAAVEEYRLDEVESEPEVG